MNLLQALREGGQVQRLHATPHLQPNTVAQHSWGMAMLLRALYPGEPPQHLLWAVLTHDVPERWLGDTPAPAKWNRRIGVALKLAEQDISRRLNINFTLTVEEQAWLHGLDAADLWLYCLEERSLGNSMVQPMLEACYTMLLQESTPIQIREWAVGYTGERTSDVLDKE